MPSDGIELADRFCVKVLRYSFAKRACVYFKVLDLTTGTAGIEPANLRELTVRTLYLIELHMPLRR